MVISVRHIDFLNRAVELDIRSCRKAQVAELANYFAHCCSLGFETISVVRRGKLSKADEKRLAGTCQKHGVQLRAAAGSSRRQPKSNTPMMTCADSPADNGTSDSITYTLQVTDFDAALNTIKEFVLLIGWAVPLDANTLSRLRLAVYELTANSIEHGTFVDPAERKIEVQLEITESQVTAVYKDNATIFKTVKRRALKIENQIKSERMRGLGLFMLVSLSDTLSFARKEGQNCTTITLERNQSKPSPKARRKDMQEFKVEVKRHRENAVVLKPIGSVDSVTTPTLQQTVKNAIDDGDNTVILDLSETDFISSAGFGLILGSTARIREKGGDLILMGVPQEILYVLEIMSVDDYFQMIDSLDELTSPAR